MKRLIVFCALSAMLAIPVGAQEVVKAKPGEEVRVGWIGSMGEDCVAKPRPTVRPSKVADHGQLRLTGGDVVTNSVPSCPGAKIPAVIIFYKSSAGFTGTDSFALTTGTGDPRTYTVTVAE
jgi:hypothetical protein